MALTSLANSLKAQMDNGNPNTLASALQKMRIGSQLRACKTRLLKQVPVASGVQLATLQVVKLPEDAKACTIFRATARAGGVTGELAVQTFGTTPATGQIAVAPNGDIVVLAADAITSLDILYEPEPHDVVEYIGLVPATGVVAIPAPALALGVVGLIEAEVLAGAVTGNKIVLVPAAGLPATTKATLDLAKANVSFNNATDAPTSVRIKLAVAQPDYSALLEAASTTF